MNSTPSAMPPSSEHALPARRPPEIEWLFLDLDGTLWDHDRASIGALGRLCREFDLPADEFISRFERVNEEAWERLGEGSTTRDRMRVERFETVLAEIGPEWLRRAPVRELSRRYLEIYLEKPNAFWIEGGRPLLAAADRAGLRVALLTNGFSDTQLDKIRQVPEFKTIQFIWGPEEAGCLKPRREFYLTALRRAGGVPARTLMIGDSLISDVLAPLSLGIMAWWFNPRGAPLPPPPPSFPSFERIEQVLPLFDPPGEMERQ